MAFAPVTLPLPPWASRPGPPTDRGNATVITAETVIAPDTVIRIAGGPWWEGQARPADTYAAAPAPSDAWTPAED